MQTQTYPFINTKYQRWNKKKKKKEFLKEKNVDFHKKNL